MSSVNVSLPGFNAPAAGFDQPFEMLEACHERVQRSLDLLLRVRQHVARQGHDADSRRAVADVLRYFDLAAPLHHQDEELHLFPLLRAHPEPPVRAAVVQLEKEHRRMDATWARLRALLLRWRDDAGPPVASADEDALIDAFIALYQDHVPLEETLVYPAARAALDTPALMNMGREMAARRKQG
ncbi:MAG: hemerythrin domain-containing protein [Burkholderiaceae bacterium]|jgi:hemerythrin-like domain-containing protein|nr:hemerythrin domain-containing protein [Burkholderiaceae bacterium]